MTNEQVYLKLSEKIDELIKVKVDKADCNTKHSGESKLIWGLFGVNIVGIVGLIITVLFMG